MKKVLLSLAIVLVLLWSYETVFAQGKGKGTGGRAKQTEKVQREPKRRQVDANEPSEQGKEKRVRGQAPDRVRKFVQRKTRRKERQKIPVIKGKEHQQQLKALETQMVHEEAKHRRRIARLKRIRELAAEENDTKTVERVAKLLQKELLRHNHKRQRIQEGKEKVLQLVEKSLSEDAEEVIKKGADKRKPKAKEQKRDKDKGKRSEE